MKPYWKRILVSTMLVAVGAAAGATYQKFGAKMTKAHTLKFPLLLSGEEKAGPLYLLPTGTTMYLDQTYPEGFSRYIVYVNVDRFPLPTHELSDPTSIRPITAYPMEKEDLTRLLSRNPVTKAELAAILNSGQLTKAEIREVLAEYSN